MKTVMYNAMLRAQITLALQFFGRLEVPQLVEKLALRSIMESEKYVFETCEDMAKKGHILRSDCGGYLVKGGKF